MKSEEIIICLIDAIRDSERQSLIHEQNNNKNWAQFQDAIYTADKLKKEVTKLQDRLDDTNKIGQLYRNLVENIRSGAPPSDIVCMLDQFDTDLAALDEEIPF